MSIELGKRAYKTDLEDLEARLLEKITELFQRMTGQFYTKEEFNKKISTINRKVKDMTNIMNQQSHEKEDGMLTKKSLGPMACASCEQGLVNVSGMQIDYHTWKKMPARETNDRIARYG